MKTSEIKKFLNGYEVSSIAYEGVVYVKNGEAFRDGEKIKVSCSKLYREYTYGELSSNWRSELRVEFANLF